MSGNFSKAFNLIEDIGAELKDESADIYQRISMLIAKATLFAKVGKPEKGFSVAVRAASTAYRARLMPTLWEAIGVVANILNAVGESKAAGRLLDAVIPQVCTDTSVLFLGSSFYPFSMIHEADLRP